MHYIMANVSIDWHMYLKGNALPDMPGKLEVNYLFIMSPEHDADLTDEYF